MTGIQRVMTAWSFMSVSRARSSHKILMKHSVWLICHVCFTKSLLTLYIPSLPTYCKECFSKKKPQHTHLKVRDCYTHNHLHIFLWFFSTPTSPSLNPWEVDNPNTYHTQSECQVMFWCCWEALEEANHWQMQLGWIARFGKTREDKVPRSQLVVGVWRAQVHGVD